MKTMQFRFNRNYAAPSVLLLLTEVIIAVFIHDEIIRPFGGDFLIVIFLYCFLKSFLVVDTLLAAIIVLLISYMMEALQYFKIVDVLGLEKSVLARTIIGTHFSWTDLMAYTVGIFVVLLIEMQFNELKKI